ncbi:TPA: Arc family DNA-binding protein [Pseudomonas aeruginosa]
MFKTKAPAATTIPLSKFVVRLPNGMREQVAEVARANHRSMNSEIISRLEVSLQADSMPSPSLEPMGELTAEEKRLIDRVRMLDLKQQAALVVLLSPPSQSAAPN